EPRLRRLSVILWEDWFFRCGDKIPKDILGPISVRLGELYREEEDLRDLIFAIAEMSAWVVRRVTENSLDSLKTEEAEEREELLGGLLSMVEADRSGLSITPRIPLTDGASTLSEELKRELTELLSHPDAETRALSAEILAQVDVPESTHAILCRRLRDPDKSVRFRAAIKILPKSYCVERATEVLIECLDSGREGAKRAVLRELRFEPTLPEHTRVLEAVRRVVDSGEDSTRRLALVVVLRYTEAEDSARLLIDLLRSTDPSWSKAQDFLLQQLDRHLQLPLATKFLVEMVRSGGGYWSNPLGKPCRALVSRSNRGVALPLLAEGLRSVDPRWIAVRFSILKILADMGGDAGVAAFLCNALAERDHTWVPLTSRILKLFASTSSADPCMLSTAFLHLGDNSYATKVVASFVRKDSAALFQALESSSGWGPRVRASVLACLRSSPMVRPTEKHTDCLLRGLELDGVAAENAARLIIRLPMKSPASFKAVVRVADHSNPEVRRTLGGRALTVTRANDQGLVTALREGPTRDQRILLRLLNYHRGSGKIYPTLRELVSSKDIVVAALASSRLAELGGGVLPVPLEPLLSSFETAEGYSRVLATQALAAYPLANPRVEAQWLKFLKDDSDWQPEALSALVRVSEPSEAIVERVAEIARNPSLSGEVLSVLQSWGTQAKGAFDTLFQAYHSADEDFRRPLIASLLAVAPKRKELQPIVRKILRGDEELAEALIYSLGISARAILPELLEHPGVESDAVQLVLSRLGRQAADAVPAVIQAIRRSRSNREEYFSLLQKIGPQDRRIIPVLTDMLYDLEFRGTAIELLAGFGPAASDAIPVLENLLGGLDLESIDVSERDWDEQAHAAWAIQKIRGTLKETAKE
ncbi:MAG: HEAT repeat domain-containing protein, partial [Planctomycetota bacterium]